MNDIHEFCSDKTWMLPYKINDTNMSDLYWRQQCTDTVDVKLICILHAGRC